MSRMGEIHGYLHDEYVRQQQSLPLHTDKALRDGHFEGQTFGINMVDALLRVKTKSSLKATVKRKEEWERFR
jgi:hypothetical protein